MARSFGGEDSMSKRAEQWRKALMMLEAVKVDPKKLKEMEGLISRITSNLEESINRGELPDSRPLYEQQSLAIKLQFTLENLREGTNELEQLKKRLQSLCERMHIERKIRVQMRGQLQKKSTNSLQERGQVDGANSSRKPSV